MPKVCTVVASAFWKRGADSSRLSLLSGAPPIESAVLFARWFLRRMVMTGLPLFYFYKL